VRITQLSSHRYFSECGSFERKFDKVKKTPLIDKRNLLFFKQKKNRIITLTVRARFMAFHGQVNSETTIYATGLEYEASHYSNRRTVETFSRAAYD